MKTLNQFKLGFVTLLAIFAILTISCDKKDPPPDEDELEVTFDYTPNPAVIDTAITFTFEVEHNGMHMAVTNYTCEVGVHGGASHDEVSLTADPSEEGHYSGSHTFTATGEFEVHFSFHHEGETHEKEFSLTVQ